ncbi:MAG: carbon monoxide dehydrogenase [Desulfobacterales bacterium]|nr:carbon monoxide dehydrogenase [Desulfobacterales bacterium]
MAFSIALAGKGGTGKTTLAGLLVKYLLHHHKTPVLAVDADSNSNLNEVLGRRRRRHARQRPRGHEEGRGPSGMTKDVFMSMKLEQAVAESEGFDLIVMGRPEGAGCYCAANSLLTGFLEKLVDNYPYIVMDNEAGMEHVSRLTTKNVNVLLLVSDPSRRGLQAALRIDELARELNIGVGKSCLVINQVKEPPSARGAQADRATPASSWPAPCPRTATVYDFDFRGRPDHPDAGNQPQRAGGVCDLRPDRSVIRCCRRSPAARQPGPPSRRMKRR